MVQLKAKGNNRYVEANLPENIGLAEAEVVLSCLREAVDTAVELSQREVSETVLQQVVGLKKTLMKVSSEAEEMAMIVQVIERRMMDL